MNTPRLSTFVDAAAWKAGFGSYGNGTFTLNADPASFDAVPIDLPNRDDVLGLRQWHHRLVVLATGGFND